MAESKIKVKVEMDFNISLWQAIKIRVAGKNFEFLVAEFSKEIKK